MVNKVCYNGTCGKLSFRYWNDNISEINYAANELPANSYVTRELLAENYSGFSSKPYYIRSVLIDGNVVGHQTCAWEENNNKEFCLSPGYWAGTLGVQDADVAEHTLVKLVRDIENELGITVNSPGYNYTQNYASCNAGAYAYCSVRYDGHVYCGANNVARCSVYATGSARCYVE